MNKKNSFSRIYFSLFLFLSAATLATSMLLYTEIKQNRQAVFSESNESLQNFDQALNDQLAKYAQFAFALTQSQALSDYEIHSIVDSKETAFLELIDKQLIDSIAIESLSNTISGVIDIYFPSIEKRIGSSNGNLDFDWKKSYLFKQWQLEEINGSFFLVYYLANNNNVSQATPSETSYIVRIAIQAEELFPKLLQNSANTSYFLAIDNAFLTKGNQSFPEDLQQSIRKQEDGNQSTINFPDFTTVSWKNSPRIHGTIGTLSINQTFLPNVLLYILSCLSIILFCGGLFFITLFFLRKRIEKPVSDLLQGMRYFQKGIYDYRITENNHFELAYLIEQFNVTGEKIKELINKNYQQEITLQKEKITQLQMQINPHFLYNCLSFIDSAAQLGLSEEASQMSRALASYYRYTLTLQKNTIKLQDEIDNIENYLKIFSLRTERVNFSYTISHPLLQTAFLPLLLQPMIENAIKYGLEKNEGPFDLEIRSSILEDGYQIAIYNSGKPLSQQQMTSLNQHIHQSDSAYEHIGLANAYQRMLLEFGSTADLYFTPIEQGVCIVLKLPLRREKNEFIDR